MKKIRDGEINQEVTPLNYDVYKFKSTTYAKGNAVMKLESLARMNGFDSGGAHSALFDAELTVKVLK